MTARNLRKYINDLNYDFINGDSEYVIVGTKQGTYKSKLVDDVIKFNQAKIKTYKVYFSITHKCKRFYIYTGLQSTEKFDGMVFPRSDKSAKAKTKRLAELYSNVEDYVLLHKGEDVPMLKSHLKEIIKGGSSHETSVLNIRLS